MDKYFTSYHLILCLHVAHEDRRLTIDGLGMKSEEKGEGRFWLHSRIPISL